MRIALVAALTASVTAHAQGVGRRYAEAPTSGVALPTAPLAGDHDARAVAVNPGGLALVRGSELAVALEREDAEVATRAGQGLGAYWAAALGGGLVPRLGVGVGLEWVRAARGRFTPEPDQPLRATLGLAAALGRNVGVGVAWHHFHADGALGGADTFDLGLSARLGNHAAIGVTLRDVATSRIGGAPVQRRYEAELVARPRGSDTLELALGGRVGETRGNVDGWLRSSLRVADGVYLHGAVENRELGWLDDGAGPVEPAGRDLQATLGLELSFGELGVTSLVSALRDPGGGAHVLGGGVVVRRSSRGPASLLGTPDHIERVDLAGAIGVRELTALVVRLRAIARDPTAKAVVVTFDGVSSGWAALDELRGELVRMRGAGKRVFAYMVSGTGRDYYVATAADRIYLDPAGGLRLIGMAGTTMYFRGAFEQFGIQPQFEKIAEYKTAPEQYTEIGPTRIAARMRNALYDSLWERWVAAVAAARKLSPEQVRALVDAGPYIAGELASHGTLVDAVGGPERIGELVSKELGEVLPVLGPTAERPERWRRPGVAIIYVDGDIIDGKSQRIPVLGQALAGGETLVAALVEARNDPRIGAIVLRIDSPGGSALASELIAREVFATRGTKPIICSLSNLAASGGYFVAAGCDLIFAEPMTITGSIGIFYGKFDVGGLAHKLGVTTDTWKRGKRADLESMYRPYTDEERAVLQDKLRYVYGRFVGAVSEGRGITKDAVDAIGRGHVWSGAQALPIKLIDRFGGLGDALDEARRRLGLAEATQLELVELPRRPASLLATIGGLLGVEAEATVGITALPIVRQLVQGIPASVLISPGVAHARLPVDIAWE
jgi:protease IV